MVAAPIAPGLLQLDGFVLRCIDTIERNAPVLPRPLSLFPGLECIHRIQLPENLG